MDGGMDRWVNGWMMDVRMYGWTNGYGYEYCSGCMSTLHLIQLLQRQSILQLKQYLHWLILQLLQHMILLTKAGPWLANWECLYCDWSLDKLWNIAWALGKSRAPPSWFPSGSGYISQYIPPLVTIQIQSLAHMFYFLLKYNHIEKAHRKAAGFEGMVSKRNPILKSYSKLLLGWDFEETSRKTEFKLSALFTKSWHKLTL